MRKSKYFEKIEKAEIIQTTRYLLENINEANWDTLHFILDPRRTLNKGIDWKEAL